MSVSANDSLETVNGANTSEDRAFEKWRRGAAWLTGIGLTPEDEVARARARQSRTQQAQWEKCEKWKNDLMKSSPAVIFMMKQMALLGYPVSSQQMACEPCESVRSGGFSSADGSILLCQDKLMSKRHLEDTIMHEMIHAYDRVKFDVDWKDCRHHACSEIRASNLSGDCKWTREITRGFFSFSKQHQECVKRRATISVKANPSCSGPGVAERAVKEVWGSCFKDTRPFDEIY